MGYSKKRTSLEHIHRTLLSR